MGRISYFHPDEEPSRHWRIVTRIGDYTVHCTESAIYHFQRDFIQTQKDKGIDLRDIVFIYSETKYVPLTGVR